MQIGEGLRTVARLFPLPREKRPILAEQDRKTRFASRLKQLIPVAVETKNVQGAVALARLIMRLEGWLDPKDDPPEPQQPSPDMSRLLESLESPPK